MKDLPVKFWAKRGYFIINATRVGLSHSYGNFATEKEAVLEAEKLKAKFVLGRDVQAEEKPKLFSVAQAISQYLANQILLQKKPYYEGQKFNLSLLAAVKFDGLALGKQQIERFGRKSVNGRHGGNCRQFLLGFRCQVAVANHPCFLCNKHQAGLLTPHS
jgi:hypothetical protein